MSKLNAYTYNLTAQQCADLANHVLSSETGGSTKSKDKNTDKSRLLRTKLCKKIVDLWPEIIDSPNEVDKTEKRELTITRKELHACNMAIHEVILNSSNGIFNNAVMKVAREILRTSNQIEKLVDLETAEEFEGLRDGETDELDPIEKE